ncbi:TonB-dependent receptor [Croceicoccus sediminis]|uniref:TonB-dependent receptor n=1 Tax=Croceicoccus sediminis TaxID=2571150 RepID=UPI0014789A9D|nr:TonB-dependent receptor [Croceicoccus sediminis]
MRTNFVHLCGTAMALAIAVPAAAQDTGSSDQQGADPASRETGVNVIVVTAQKRAENVQDVPIAISAFGGDALRERAVSDVAQLSNAAPNVTLDAGTPFSGSTAVLSAFIRGIGANDFAMNIDPGVGIYLDGVYLARTVGANLDLPDVERIEVLKGPQGTLFGRNTIGGAISVVTREPGDELAFTGDVATGRFNRLDIRGYADLPISENLRSSVTFSTKNRDGYQKRVPFPADEPYSADRPMALPQTGYETSRREGGQDEWSLRGKLVWDSGDRVKVTFGGDYMRINSSAMANSVLAVTTDVGGPFAGLAANNIPGTALDVATGSSGFFFGGLYNFCINATADQIAARNAGALCGVRGTPLDPAANLAPLASVNVDGDPSNDRLTYDDRFVSTDKDKSYATGNSFSDMETFGFTGIVDVELTDRFSLKSITGYRDLKWASGMDLDNSPVAIIEPSFSLSQNQFSQELQLLGEAMDGAMNLVAGAYYFREEGSMRDFVTFAEGLLQIIGPNDLETENYAFFGQVDWRVSDLVGITVGGRYTSEDKQFVGGQSDANGFNYKLFNCPDYNGDVVPCPTILGFPVEGEPLRYYVDGTQKKSFSNFSPMAGLQLHPSDDVMVYGRWSRGYKTGGWTTRLSNPLPYAPDFDEEKAESFEVGVKATLFDRMLQLNAAAFTTKYKGIQLNFQQGVSPTVQNAGTARIKGFEVEAVVAPSYGLTINASLGYTDATYTDVLPPAQVAPNPFQAGTFVGADLPKSPDWKFNLTPRYEFDVGGGSIALLADYTYTSRMWNDSERTLLLERPSVHMLNANATYDAPSGGWSLTAGVTNILNERYIVTGQSQAFGAGMIYGTWSRPSEWYLRLGVDL